LRAGVQAYNFVKDNYTSSFLDGPGGPLGNHSSNGGENERPAGGLEYQPRVEQIRAIGGLKHGGTGKKGGMRV
jgi:hypothetical protein